jgi:hypothetical protein
MLITISIPDDQVSIVQNQIDQKITIDVWCQRVIQGYVNQFVEADKAAQLAKYGLTPIANLDQATIDKLKATLTPIV